MAELLRISTVLSGPTPAMVASTIPLHDSFAKGLQPVRKDQVLGQLGVHAQARSAVIIELRS